MKLSSRRGQRFDIRIRGYQFPHMETEDYDSNWLMISGDVVHPRGAWRFSDPCLLTYEAEGLASWLEMLANSEPLPTTCGFIEPNLEFRAVARGQHGILQVHFNLEARPDWASSSAAREQELWVEFPFDELDLRALGREWRKELEAFPQRAPR